MYFRMSKTNKAKVNRPKNLLFPYLESKIKTGEVSSIPPPIPTIVTPEQKTKHKKTIDNYYKQEKILTKKQLKEYNKLAKSYNRKLNKKNVTIDFRDIKRLKHLYNLMSDKQKKNAEPFPKFPIAPENPVNKEQKVSWYTTKDGESLYYVTKNNVIQYYNRWGQSVTQDGKTLNSQPQTNSKKSNNSGSLEIKGETHYYYTNKNGKTTYYTIFGEEIDKKGNKIVPVSENKK